MKYAVLLVLLFVTQILVPKGFLPGTLVKIPGGYKPIEQIEEGDYVVCSNEHGFVLSMPVLFVMKKHTDELVEITCEGEKLYVDPDQQINTGNWVEARDLISGLYPKNLKDPEMRIRQVKLIEVDAYVYDLTIDSYANFYVSTFDILVHNFVIFVRPEVAEVLYATAIKVGGAVFAMGSVWVTGRLLNKLTSSNKPSKKYDHVPTSVLQAEDGLGGLDGPIFYYDVHGHQIPESSYDPSKPIVGYDACGRQLPPGEMLRRYRKNNPSHLFGSGSESKSSSIFTPDFKPCITLVPEPSSIRVMCKKGSDRPKVEVTDAQAPGKPTGKDGFTPPKKWDGSKVKHPKTGKHGYPDKKGNVWVPTGPKGHGGPHWDVQKPGGGYDNVLPGGKIRGEE